MHTAHQSPNRRPNVSSADHQANDARLTNAPGGFQDLHDQSAQIVELREQLVDEFHHRLKNSLQMLYGLLQIAWSKTDSTEAREALSDTSRRIGAMGTAQQIFYSVHNSTDVNGQTRAHRRRSEKLKIRRGRKTAKMPTESG
jgi:two-component sensor histidine kinase